MTDSNENAVGSDLLLTNPEVVMQSWFKHNNKDFMQLIVHEAKQEIFIIEQFMKVLLNNPDFADQQVKSLWGEQKIEENGAVIMKELAKLRQIMSIVWEYSESHLSADASSPEI